MNCIATREMTKPESVVKICLKDTKNILSYFHELDDLEISIIFLFLENSKNFQKKPEIVGKNNQTSFRQNKQGPLWSVVVLCCSVVVRCGPLWSVVVRCGPLWYLVGPISRVAIIHYFWTFFGKNAELNEYILV